MAQKRVKAHESPDKHDGETIVWAFGIVDQDGPWGWRTEASSRWWRDILPKLRNFESMTWSEILRAVGGRRRGNNNHAVLVERLSQKAKVRLVEIGQEDVSELFSLRLTGTWRIYGIRDRRALKLLWFDPYHGTNARAVCPVQRG